MQWLVLVVTLLILYVFNKFYGLECVSFKKQQHYIRITTALILSLWFVSRLDPMILHKPISGIQQTCITFARNTQVNVMFSMRL